MVARVVAAETVAVAMVVVTVVALAGLAAERAVALGADSAAAAAARREQSSVETTGASRARLLRGAEDLAAAVAWAAVEGWEWVVG